VNGAGAPAEVDVDAAVAELNLALRSHGGAVEHSGFSETGRLRLRMLGMCAGCRYRPMTTAATIRPFIRERLGVDVDVLGARISEEAEERLAKALEGSYRTALPLLIADR
jgi:Fe-S cluster biogenesis protein NfuA